MVQNLGGFGKDSCKMEGRKRAKFVGNKRGLLLSLSKRQVWQEDLVASMSEQQLRGACGTAG